MSLSQSTNFWVFMYMCHEQEMQKILLAEHEVEGLPLPATRNFNFSLKETSLLVALTNTRHLQMQAHTSYHNIASTDLEITKIF